MIQQHLVRFGAMGLVGQFSAADGTCYPRSAKVIMRTRRGLEIGDVLAPPTGAAANAAVDGTILRGITGADELLATRINQNKLNAFAACSSRLAELNVPATLIDVELLFDGRSLFFYFMGDTTPEIEQITAELAEVYEARVKFRQFTEAVVNGCGPNCGTEDAEGGCSNCTSCAVAGACGVRP